MKVKIDIISGFLGAGKTTLIKKLISEELYYKNKYKRLFSIFLQNIDV